MLVFAGGMLAGFCVGIIIWDCFLLIKDWIDYERKNGV